MFHSSWERAAVKWIGESSPTLWGVSVCEREERKEKDRQVYSSVFSLHMKNEKNCELRCEKFNSTDWWLQLWQLLARSNDCCLNNRFFATGRRGNKLFSTGKKERERRYARRSWRKKGKKCFLKLRKIMLRTLRHHNDSIAEWFASLSISFSLSVSPISLDALNWVRILFIKEKVIAYERRGRKWVSKSSGWWAYQNNMLINHAMWQEIVRRVRRNKKRRKAVHLSLVLRGYTTIPCNRGKFIETIDICQCKGRKKRERERDPWAINRINLMK